MKKLQIVATNVEPSRDMLWLNVNSDQTELLFYGVNGWTPISTSVKSDDTPGDSDSDIDEGLWTIYSDT